MGARYQPFRTPVSAFVPLPWVTLNAVGETRHAVMVLERAHERQPAHRDLLTTLIAFNGDIGTLARARHFAEILVETYPRDRAARRLLEEIKRSGS